VTNTAAIRYRMHESIEGWDLGSYAGSVGRRVRRLESDEFVERLWERDASLWISDPGIQSMIAGALGWLSVGTEMVSRVAELDSFAAEVQADGTTDVVHMGMGGSSLAPLVLGRAFGAQDGWPRLHVLDTTDPATVLGLDEALDPDRSLFIEASKSGTTAEPLAFGAYFYDRLTSALGSGGGRHMVTITDPGSPLIGESEARGFRRIVLNFADIGGRFSALSFFGLLPARLVGIDVGDLLHRANAMATACREPGVAGNPGVMLGAALGELALQGRDKLTLVTPPSIATFGMWLEQLIAESTGKEGKGVLPIAGESLGAPSAYGDDRVFVALDSDEGTDADAEARLAALVAAGHPLIRLSVGSPADMGAEFFRWEIATATIGAVLGINPFDQPNVQQSKDITNRLLAAVRETGTLPPSEPTGGSGVLSFYGHDGAEAGVRALDALLDTVAAGDYVALQAYLTESDAVDAALGSIRLRLRDGLGVATTVGYGPRFLHSTGQFHKGGPDSGVFLQLTVDDVRDVAIPGQPYSFGDLKQAQALGDLEALWQGDRRALRIHLGPDTGAGLAALSDLVQAYLDTRPDV